MTTKQMPQQIRASIHQDAINRVPEFFNATTTDILNELLQNSRRSGASRVDITMGYDDFTISDDGHGIEDPNDILAFGGTGWEEQAAVDEHPAGMGLYSLARRENVRIRSRTRDGAAWQVRLTPDHFIGKVPAPVEMLQDDERTITGTTVNFTRERSEDPRINEIARYCQLPVYVNGEQQEQRDFLEGCNHAEEWRGIRIGVWDGKGVAASTHMKKLNFHGIVIREIHLPMVEGITRCWGVRADVRDCPGLELTLPARKEVVENSFMDEFRLECRAVIYRAMKLQNEPVDVPSKVRNDAATMGIDLPEAAPKLEKWDPPVVRETHYFNRNDRLDVGEDAIVMDLDLLEPDQQALARAAEREGIKNRFFKMDDRLEGYPWYDRITRATDVEITISDQEGDHNLDKIRQGDEKLGSQRPDRITFTIGTIGADGVSEIHLSSDLVFENEEEEYMDEIRPLVTRDSAIQASELVGLMIDSFFNPSHESEADSLETQEIDHKDAYERTAIRLMASRDDAIVAIIRHAVERHIRYEIPPGTTATIRINRDGSTQITLEEEE